MKIIVPLIAILMIVFIVGCTNTVQTNNPPTPSVQSAPVEQTTTPAPLAEINTTNTTVEQNTTSPWDIYANTSLIDEGINELNQVE